MIFFVKIIHAWVLGIMKKFKKKSKKLKVI